MIRKTPPKVGHLNTKPPNHRQPSVSEATDLRKNAERVERFRKLKAQYQGTVLQLADPE